MFIIDFVLTVGAGNPGDWWTTLDSEPSLGSTSQLHASSLRGPELANSMMELDGPFTNVNKGNQYDEISQKLASLFRIIHLIFKICIQTLTI